MTRSTRCLPLAVAGLLLNCALLLAQHSPPSPPPPAASARESSQFDFLLGEWTLTVSPKVSGLVAVIHGVPKLVGTWKASRAFDGRGLEDELRIIDASGNPSALSHSLRVYDPVARHWVTAGLDVFRSRAGEATGEFKDGAMVMMSHSNGADGKTTVNRSRFFEITPTSFRFQQDRSTDDGRTWQEGVLRIEAKRTAGAPR